ncbi:MAG: phage major capsid protein [Sedimentisphaerales bacterium]|jgi:HK97 family phage major capsid protein
MPLQSATVEKVAEGFKAASDRMDALENDMKLAFQEMAKEVGDITKKLSAYGRSVLAASNQAGVYKGIWANEQQAKEFGEIIRTIIGKPKDIGTLTNQTGGILVPEIIAGQIIQLLGVYGKFRKNTFVFPMGSGKQIVPRMTADLTVYCPEEGKEITKSDIKLDPVGLYAKKLACLAVINRELEEDAIIGLAEIVGASLVRSLAKKEDEIGFCGDGTAKYFGMTGIIGALQKINADPTRNPGLIVGTGNAYSELELDDFLKVIGILPTMADDGAQWYMSKKFYYNVVYPLAKAAGVANIFEVLSSQKGRYLFGYPVEFVHCMPYVEANSQICAILGDLKLGAYLGERKSIEIAQSYEVLFGNDQIALRGVERIDINAFGVSTGTELGAIVGLITNGS